MLEQIDQLEAAAKADLAAVSSPDELEQFRIKYLGSKGELKQLMARLKDVPKQDKPAFGQKANVVKTKIQKGYKEKQAALAQSAAPTFVLEAGTPQAVGRKIDVTEPGLPSFFVDRDGKHTVPADIGREHIITQTVDELIDVFGRMGFDVATGPELEDEHHNFVALNIPPEHPARDPLDNFYITDPDEPNPNLMRSQTSTVQIRVMEQTKPPVRIISTGRVYRPDEHDATHYSMFHQIEGLYVDKKVSMVDLKTTLLQFAHAYFGPEADVRLVPSYFPFTEPSAELYIKTNLGGTWQWMEIGGCGMVDPNVFEAVGYDPETWTGFAFGLGIERIAMRKYGISDIRWLFENDVRFLRQF